MRFFPVVCVIAASAVLVLFSIPAIAQLRSNCIVEVIGRVRGSRVNVRSGPGTFYAAKAYVLVGQYVNLLSDYNGNPVTDSDGRFTWYMVEYLPTRTRGWIREDLLSPRCS